MEKDDLFGSCTEMSTMENGRTTRKMEKEDLDGQKVILMMVITRYFVICMCACRLITSG